MDIVLRCLNPDPLRRPTAEQSVNFLKEFYNKVSAQEWNPDFDLGVDTLLEDLSLVRECKFIKRV